MQILQFGQSQFAPVILLPHNEHDLVKHSSDKRILPLHGSFLLFTHRFYKESVSGLASSSLGSGSFLSLTNGSTNSRRIRITIKITMIVIPVVV